MKSRLLPAICGLALILLVNQVRAADTPPAVTPPAVTPPAAPGTTNPANPAAPATTTPLNAADEALEAVRERADAAYQQGDYETVLELADQVLKQSAKDFVALHLRASAKIELGRLEGNTKLVREGISDAREAVGQVGRQHPWVYVPYLYGLTSLTELERRPEHSELAIKVVTPILEREMVPADRGQLVYQRGLAHQARQEVDQAARDFVEAARLAPDLLGPQLQMAKQLALRGNVKGALAAFDQAVKSFPKNPNAYLERGMYRQAVGQLSPAAEDFSKVIELEPRSFPAYVGRGISWAEQNDQVQALADFEKALALNADDPGALRLRGLSRLAVGQLDGGIQDFNKALELAPQMLPALEDRGFAYYYKHEYGLAMSDLNKARARGPKSLRLAPWQYITRMRLGQPGIGLAEVKESLKDKTYPDDWNRQLCLFIVGELTADQLIEKSKSSLGAAAADQECEAHYFMGEIQAAKGETEGATSHFRAALATNASRLAAYRGAKYALGQFRTSNP